MPPHSSKFFRNEACAFFPCHKGIDPASFNCLFCFCPLHYRPDCGGDYVLRPSGAKDCSGCVFPHKAENYEAILGKLRKR